MSTSSRLKSVFSAASPKQERHNLLKRKYCQFNWIFLVAALTPMLSIGLFNIVIDPYGVINTSTFSGVNQTKPDKWKHQRLFKAVDVTRINPVTVFLGSSRTNLGLDPVHPALNSNQPAYNLALNAANLYETRRYLQHSLANQEKIKLVIIGLDSIMFNSSLTNQAGFVENRLEKQTITIQDAINTVFSLDTFSSSRNTLIANINHSERDIYYPNGFMLLERPKQEKTGAEIRKSIKTYFEYNTNYHISDEYLAEFKKIVDICRQKDIKLIVFISPSHATQWEAIRATGHWSTFEQWKRKIVKIAPVWDFSGYNSITTEPISDRMKNYIDDSHYRKEIGDLVLNRILHYQEEKVPQDFGVLLTPENIESNLAKIRADRELWAKNNPAEVKLVQDIRHQVDYQPLNR